MRGHKPTHGAPTSPAEAPSKLRRARKHPEPIWGQTTLQSIRQRGQVGRTRAEQPSRAGNRALRHRTSRQPHTPGRRPQTRKTNHPAGTEGSSTNNDAPAGTQDASRWPTGGTPEHTGNERGLRQTNDQRTKQSEHTATHGPATTRHAQEPQKQGDTARGRRINSTDSTGADPPPTTDGTARRLDRNPDTPRRRLTTPTTTARANRSPERHQGRRPSQERPKHPPRRPHHGKGLGRSPIRVTSAAAAA